MEIVLIFDPQSPMYVSAVSIGDRCNVDVENNLAFLAGTNVGIYNIQNRFFPQYVGEIVVPGFRTVADVVGSTAYVASSAGLYIFDVSDPGMPIEIGNITDVQDADRLEVQGDLAFVLDNGGSTYVVDVSDPANPTLLDTINAPGWERGLFLTEAHLFIAGDYLGVSAYDISDPFNIVHLGFYDVETDAWDVHVEGDIAYVADETFGITIIDFADCPGCPADLNGDGMLDFFDVSAFLQLFVANDPASDFREDGMWDFFDVSSFLVAFSNGCP